MLILPALDKFFAMYQQSYLNMLGEPPRYYPLGQDSACIIDREDSNIPMDNSVCWRAVIRTEPADFSNVEHALAIKLLPEINAFYGNSFAAPLLFDSDFGCGELIQVWNQDDFDTLQQNIIGHLMMKRSLNQPLTWFIGTVGDEHDEMLTVNNEDGSVWLEIPGDIPHQKLADSLNDFIELLTPRVAPATAPLPDEVSNIDHPGLLARFKRMWHHLSK